MPTDEKDQFATVIIAGLSPRVILNFIVLAACLLGFTYALISFANLETKKKLDNLENQVNELMYEVKSISSNTTSIAVNNNGQSTADGSDESQQTTLGDLSPGKPIKPLDTGNE